MTTNPWDYSITVHATVIDGSAPLSNCLVGDGTCCGCGCQWWRHNTPLLMAALRLDFWMVDEQLAVLLLLMVAHRYQIAK